MVERDEKGKRRERRRKRNMGRSVWERDERGGKRGDWKVNNEKLEEKQEVDGGGER